MLNSRRRRAGTTPRFATPRGTSRARRRTDADVLARRRPRVGSSPRVVRRPLARAYRAVSAETRVRDGTRLVDDLVEVHLHARVLQVPEVRAVVDELGDLVQPELLRALAEHEEHRVDDVALPRAVRADDGGEGFVKRADVLRARVGLEVLEHHLLDDEALLRRVGVDVIVSHDDRATLLRGVCAG